MDVPELLLASTSPYRRELLARLGLPFRVRGPLLDEEGLKQAAGPRTPSALAEYLARAKALSLIDVEPGALIIGGDQLAEVDGTILGKPGTAGAAVEQLLRLAGRSHRLITALAVAHQGIVRVHVDTAVLHMRRLRREALERYVAADRPLDCAGSYKLEARGIVLFERVEAADQTAITGLPLIALTAILNDFGLALP